MAEHSLSAGIRMCRSFQLDERQSTTVFLVLSLTAVSLPLASGRLDGTFLRIKSTGNSAVCNLALPDATRVVRNVIECAAMCAVFDDCDDFLIEINTTTGCHQQVCNIFRSNPLRQGTTMTCKGFKVTSKSSSSNYIENRLYTPWNLTTASTPVFSINSWIIIQAKVDICITSFATKRWADYRNGFGGMPSADCYWIGNEIIYQLTSMASFKLRVEVQRTSLVWYSAEYSSFTVNSESMFYKLNVGGYSGDAGDALSQPSWPYFINNGMKFTTSDADHDNYSGGNCSGGGGGWWYNYCTTSFLNADSSAVWVTSGSTPDVRASRMMMKLV